MSAPIGQEGGFTVMTSDDEVLAGYRKSLSAFSITAIVGDSLGRTGVMSSAIKPIDRDRKIAGRALTVELSPGDLQDPLGALALVRPGDIVVIDAHADEETAIWGGLMGTLFQLKGCRGAVIDGACRDTDENREQGFQVFTRSITPRGSHTMFSGRRDDIRYQVPIICGGVLVEPGDIVVGDELGVVVVPGGMAPETLRKVLAQVEKEEETRKKVRDGWTVDQLLAEFGRI